YIHFPNWLGEWFFDELTYEERGADGKWRKPGKGNNEAFDLFCYAHAVAMLRRYERIKWDQPPAWAEPQDTNPNIFNEDSHREVVVAKRKPKVEAKPAAPQQAAGSSWLSGSGSGTGGGGWL
ncbi:terminase gpA endonuclease subunit, partial [Serratia marcescens]